MNIQTKIDQLNVSVFEDRLQMGQSAAELVAEQINKVAERKDEVRIIFASAVSQQEFLAELLEQDIPWNKIIAFHMDEYHTLSDEAPQRFGKFLKDHLFSHKKFAEVNYIGDDWKAYARKIEASPIDIVCMGIGENGHLAFNDPPVADFDDPETIKIVELDEVCRQQQVNDGAFKKIEEVPDKAVTLTIPALMKADFLSVVVPGESKANAIEKTLFGPVSTSCPATVLRLHPQATLFIDNHSSQNIMEKIS